MNKRIDELREESLVWAIENLATIVLNDNEWDVEISNKFAELIIKEGSNAIKSKAGQLGGMTSSDVYKEKILREAAEILLTHFGMK